MKTILHGPSRLYLYVCMCTLYIYIYIHNVCVTTIIKEKGHEFERVWGNMRGVKKRRGK